MKKKCLPIFLQVSAIILFNICLAGNLVGIIGDRWFTFKGETSLSTHQISYGVLRECRKDGHQDHEYCNFRTNIFEFKYMTPLEEIVPDAMFILLLLSCCCCFIGVSSCLMLHRCHGNKSQWRCGSATSAVFSLIAVLSNVVVVLYAQIGGDNMNGYKQDWTAIVVWSSTVCQIVCTVLVFILIFINPIKRTSFKENNTRSNTNYSITQYWYSRNPLEYYRRRFQHRLPSDSSGKNISTVNNNNTAYDNYEMQY